MAKEAGTTTLLNTAPVASEIDPRFLELADIICPNEVNLTLISTSPSPSLSPRLRHALSLTLFVSEKVEAEFLTGHKVDTLTDAFKASVKLREISSCRTVILTLGSRGAVVADQDQDPVHVAAEKVKAVDSVGAGDAFVGAFAHFSCNGLSTLESCRRACVVASASVTKMGTQNSYPTLDELPEAVRAM